MVTSDRQWFVRPPLGGKSNIASVGSTSNHQRGWWFVILQRNFVFKK